MIHELRFGLSDFPVIKFKLKDKIDVDALIANELFTHKCQFMVANQMKMDEVDCKLRGIRAPGQTRPDVSVFTIVCAGVNRGPMS